MVTDTNTDRVYGVLEDFKGRLTSSRCRISPESTVRGRRGEQRTMIRKEEKLTTIVLQREP